MPIEGGAFDSIASFDITVFFKTFFILFLIFYVVFAFVLYRQLTVMGRALPTQVVPFFKFVSILHIGFALALTFLVIGVF